LIVRILSYLLVPLHVLDQWVYNGFRYRPSLERPEGTSPYDRIDRVAFATNWPATAAAIREKEADWLADRPAPAADLSWVSPSMVATVMRQMEMERRAPSKHGFLGRLGEAGAYVVATRAKDEVVVENKEFFEVVGGFIAEIAPEPESAPLPKPRRARRSKLAVAGANA
jgi:hypothetical protein